MKKSIAIVGVGEMGGVFARGFLRIGHPVYPITRNMDLKATLAEIADLEAILVAVGEKDLQDTLKAIPKKYNKKLILLQNELLPVDWESNNIENPTIISVWFEKKQPKDYKVIISSPVFGPHSGIVKDALESINISCNVLNSSDELLRELVIKNLYILTSNISGLEVGGTVGQLWETNNQFARHVASDVLDIQFNLIGQELDRNELIKGMVSAFHGDVEHKCMGRSAPARLIRAINLADEAKLEVKTLRDIQSKQTEATI